MDKSYSFSFTGSVKTGKRTESSSSHICDTVTTRGKMFGSRLGVIVAFVRISTYDDHSVADMRTRAICLISGT